MDPLHPYSEAVEEGDLQVIACTACGFRHLWPIPTVAELQTLYREDFGGRVRPGFAARKQEDAAYWRLAFGRRLDAYRELLGAGMAPRRLLDVGCGTGDLLACFREGGWEVQGIEPSRQFTETLAAAGIPNLPRLTDEMTDAEWAALGRFDAINMSMFLEHVRDPLAVVRCVVRALKPGGILTIESPNDFNPLQAAAVRAHGLSRWWINRLHINYFDFEALERLVSRAGLQPVRRDAQFPIEMFLLFGELYVGNAELGRATHRKRVAFEMALAEAGETARLGRLYQAFAQQGLGRTAIVYSRKEIE